MGINGEGTEVEASVETRLVESEAGRWLTRYGYDDPLFYYNDEGRSIFDVLLRDELYKDNPIFVEVVVFRPDSLDPGTETVGYQFEDGSIVAEMGDRWMLFDAAGNSYNGLSIEVTR